MPSLRLFGRNWRIGSDDLTFPSFTEFLIRLVWVLCIFVLYMRYGANIGCSGSGYLMEFLISMMSIQGLILINLMSILIISMRGSVTNVQPRRHMSKILYIRFVLFILEFFCYVIGSLCISDPHLKCENDIILWIMFVIISLSWILFALLGLLVALVFDPLGKLNSESAIAKSIKSWERQVKFLCCCCFCGNNKDEQSQNAFKDIAELITMFFKDVNLVPSDIAVGLILLGSKKRPNPSSTNSITEQPINDLRKPWMTAPMASCFIRYAVGCYGWPMFMWEHFWTGLCRLWPKIKCCSSCHSNDMVIDDNCCMCHMAAVKIITQSKSEDFIHVSFYNRVYETPFYVVADHGTESIVVAIRGTISQRDILTDLTADCEYLQLEGASELLCVHKGIYNAAKFVYNKLLQLHILDEAFALYPDYDLVITGHSLGAGTASVLAFLLCPLYPDLRCFAFSPPGCMFNEALYKMSKDLIMSVVVGDDFIIAMNWLNMENFKLHLIDIINQANQPKFKILLGGCWQACCESKKSMDVECDSQENEESSNVNVDIPLLKEQVGRARSYYSGVQGGIIPSEEAFKTLIFPPGSIFHIQRHNDRFVSSWSDPQNFRQLLVSPNMASDHMPNYVNDALSNYVASLNESIIAI